MSVILEVYLTNNYLYVQVYTDFSQNTGRKPASS